MFRKQLVNLYLDKGFVRHDAAAEIDLIFELCAGYTRTEILLGKELDKEIKEKILIIIHERLETGKPIQQILGKSYFMGDLYIVNEHTLIPRPETEILVAECLKVLAEIENPLVLDIGTGTGCIGIEILKNNKEVNVHSVDISHEALNTALKNAVNFDVADRLNLYLSNLFEHVDKKFDLIVSNPPYIPLSEKTNLQTEVKDFEPGNALFTQDEKGTRYYEMIISQAKNYLKENGYLAFELGFGQVEEVQKLMINKEFSQIKIIKDLNHIDRVIIAKTTA